jgi:hypothetical protein
LDKRDALSSLVWLFIAVFVFIASLRMGVGEFRNPGPGFLSFWASIFLSIFTCILFGLSHFRKEEAVPLAALWKDLHWSNNVIVITAFIVYCLVLTKLGYILATMGFMIVLFSVGKMKPWAVALGSLLAVLLSYCLFYYALKIPLPRGVLAF